MPPKTQPMKTIYYMAFGWLLAGSASGALADSPAANHGERTQLSRHDLSIPGYEEIQMRVGLKPGEVAARHRHPGEEIIYVTEGTIRYDLDGQPAKTLHAGDVLFVPTGTIHSATNVGTTDAAEIGTYVVPKGKALVEWIQ
jgi:quercetin dioxygenase-like cupin family protein